MRPYIKGGTPVGSESLCRSCTYAHTMTGYRESELITVCTNVGPNIVVPFQIYECTGYYDKNRPDWQQMQKLAINVSDAPLKPLGFKVSAGFMPESDEENDEDKAAILKNVRGRLL
jgi:hypothetical protein